MAMASIALQRSTGYYVDMRKDRTPPSAFDLEVAKRLREQRRKVQDETGRAVWEIAAGARMSEQSWYLHERGDTGITLAKLRDLSTGLGMDPHDLFEALWPVREELVSFEGWGWAHSMVDTAPSLGAPS